LGAGRGTRGCAARGKRSFGQPGTPTGRTIVGAGLGLAWNVRLRPEAVRLCAGARRRGRRAHCAVADEKVTDHDGDDDWRGR
jgi:hypothetical protein